MNNKELLIKLIQEYIDNGKKYSEQLINYYSLKIPILRAWHSGIIPKDGEITNGIKYSLHGVGCFFEDGGINLDIDFGPNQRCDGFDLKRIKYYLENKGIEYENFKYLPEILNNTFNDLENSGIIYNPKWSPSEHLYYFVTKKDESFTFKY